jgi:hypothetical protein
VAKAVGWHTLIVTTGGVTSPRLLVDGG